MLTTLVLPKSSQDKIEVCRNFTTECAKNYKDGYFHYIYVDARHDYKGCVGARWCRVSWERNRFADASRTAESVVCPSVRVRVRRVSVDLEDWWPKLKPGGIFAGHDCA